MERSKLVPISLSVSWRVKPRGLTVEELSRETGVHPTLIRRYVEMDIIQPLKGSRDYLFDEKVVLRLRRIQRLRDDLGVNLIGASIISDLVEEIERLKGEIERLKRRLLSQRAREV